MTEVKAVTAFLKGQQFERDVAAIYRLLGAEVQRDVSLAGNQIDILLKERTSSGSEIKTAVECKAFSRPVGVDVVNHVASVGLLLRDRTLINRIMVVSKSGFTKEARSSADTHDVQLLELSDLQQRVHGRERALHKFEKELEEAQIQSLKKVDRPKRIFVIMPFSKEFDDVYLLGVREVAEKLGLVAERADDIEHNEQILDIIQNNIRTCDIVIADTTHQNPNVFYEIGFSHAVKVPTVLISRSGQKMPFDLKAMNHIFYETIVELRERLASRLGSMLGEPNGQWFS